MAEEAEDLVNDAIDAIGSKGGDVEDMLDEARDELDDVRDDVDAAEEDGEDMDDAKDYLDEAADLLDDAEAADRRRHQRLQALIFLHPDRKSVV